MLTASVKGTRVAFPRGKCEWQLDSKVSGQGSVEDVKGLVGTLLPFSPFYESPPRLANVLTLMNPFYVPVSATESPGTA